MCFKKLKSCFIISMEFQMKHINETRSRKFCMENKPEPHQLPPIKDDLTQRIRANQAYEWNRALGTNLDIPSPIGHRW